MKKLLTLGLVGILGCSPLATEKSKTEEYQYLKNNEWKTESRIRIAEEKMESARIKLNSLEDVEDLVNQFKSRPEEINWQSDILTLFYYNLWGDCDDASVLGIWALEQIGIQAREIFLYDNDSLGEYGAVHSTALSNDNKIFINTYHVTILKRKDSLDEVLKEIKRFYPSSLGKYDEIKEFSANKVSYHNQGTIE